MNYNMLNHISDGMIIENLNSNKIIFINSVAKQILNISNEQITNMDELISSTEILSKLKTRIQEDLKHKEKSEGIMYLKSLKGSFIEINFLSDWVDKENNIISYIFHKAKEVIGESNLSFHEVAEFLPSGIVVMNIEPELTITYANSHHYKLLGIEHDKHNDEVSRLLKDSIYEEDRSWVLSEIYDCLYKDLVVDIEFRMKSADNSIKWVRLHGQANHSATGHKLFYSNLKDLSQRKAINDKLHVERVLFYKMTELSDELLFRLDLSTNTMYLLGAKIYLFDNNTILNNAIQTIKDMDLIYPEDLHIFEDMVDCFYKGIIKNVELRCTTKNGGSQWHKVIYNFISNSDNEPMIVIGKLSNIQEQKLFEEQAKIDSLTEFYNKSTTAIETDKLFENEQDAEHTLFIIDVDNFKAINDNLGHHHGDVVLWGVANDIRKCFRDTDILGRIGGDEFIVVMRDCGLLETIHERANMICDNLRKTFKSEDDKEYSISSSIGIALYPQDGTTYTELYQNADVALYETKDKGKNGFTIFNSDLKVRKNLLISKVVKETRRKNDRKDDFINVKVIESIINLICHSDDIQMSLKTAMKYLGITYKVDRCYIYEISENKGIYQNNYQWTRDKKFYYNIQYYTSEIVDAVFKNANSDGTFWTNNIYALTDTKVIKTFELENINSIFLVSHLKTENNMFLGFDDLQTERVWTEEESRTIYYISKILFSALINYNNINKLTIDNKKLHSTNHML